MMNGSSSVITTEYPVNPKMSKKFRETLYATLSSTVNPYISYRSAVRALAQQKDDVQMKNWESFFYYGY